MVAFQFVSLLKCHNVSMSMWNGNLDGIRGVGFQKWGWIRVMDIKQGGKIGDTGGIKHWIVCVLD